MKTNPISFYEKQAEFLNPFLIESGAALMDCQSFEFSLITILWLYKEIGTQGLNNIDPEEFINGTDKKTAGALLALFKTRINAPKTLVDTLEDALDARNEIIHRYLIKNNDRLLNDRHAMTTEMHGLRRRIQKASHALDPFIKHMFLSNYSISLDEYENKIMERFISEQS